MRLTSYFIFLILNLSVMAIKYSIPYLVRIQRDGDNICSGTIVGSEWVLTAAHCVDVEGVTYTVVKHMAGGRSYELLSFQVVERHFYAADRDIAMLRLHKSIPLAGRISKVQQLSTQVPEHGFYQLVVMAYADMVSQADLDPQDLVVIGPTQCQMYYDTRELQEWEFCAAAQLKDKCQGSSGGGAVEIVPTTGAFFEVRLHGVLSWSEGCSQDPAVFTRVDVFREWILEVMDNAKAQTVPDPVGPPHVPFPTGSSQITANIFLILLNSVVLIL